LPRGYRPVSIDRADGRISVDEKRMINNRAAVNQLLPIKCKWAWEKYRAGVKQKRRWQTVLCVPKTLSGFVER